MLNSQKYLFHVVFLLRCNIPYLRIHNLQGRRLNKPIGCAKFGITEDIFVIYETRMHSRRMRTARSLTVSHHILCMPPRKNHTCLPPKKPCTPLQKNHTHPLGATMHAPRINHAPPHNHACPWEQPCMPPPRSNHACPPGATTHAPPEQPCMPPGATTCPPGSNHAHPPEQPCTPQEQPHTPHPREQPCMPPRVDRQTPVKT